MKIKQSGTILAKIAPQGEVTKLLTATFTASSLTGEPELSSYFEAGLPVKAELLSEISAPEFGIFYPAVPTSQMRPRYITAMRSESCATTARSCEMNR